MWVIKQRETNYFEIKYSKMYLVNQNVSLVLASSMCELGNSRTHTNKEIN